MRLLICEYVTGGGFLGSPIPPGLAREGDMMLAALVKDMAALSGIDAVSVRDARLGAIGLSTDCQTIQVDANPWDAWRAAVGDVDAVWPIAPESGGALLRLTTLILRTGRVLIGSRPRAVSLAASKSATVERLAACGVPVVPSLRASAVLAGVDLPASRDGWVIKPDDGAGAESTWLFRHAGDLHRWIADAPAAGNLVVQPYQQGVPASMSMICRDGRARLLSCNRQEIDIEDGAFRFRGCIVGGHEHRRADCERLAGAIAAAIPDLWGYVGVDVIDGESGLVVLEVNPRLTTSYVGLGQAIGTNPAGLVLRLLDEALDAGGPRLPVKPQRVDVEARHAA
ncbi:MAG: ATP-grasp domain-containing protein [Dongiaceae bacterium]